MRDFCPCGFGEQRASSRCAFAADGRLCAAGSDQSVQLWKTGAQWALKRTIGHVDDPTALVDRVLALEFSVLPTANCPPPAEDCRPGRAN